MRQFFVKFYDSSGIEIEDDRVWYGGRVGTDADIDVRVVAQFVKVQLSRRDCLQLGEVSCYYDVPCIINAQQI